jgi:hypothetical protein
MKLASFTGWRSGASQAITRFPWNMVCAAVGAGCGIASLHWSKNDSVVAQSMRIGMAAALGMPLFFSLRMLRERTARITRWPVELLGVVLLGLWLLQEPAKPYDAPSIYFVRWLLLLAALHFFSAVSPYVFGREQAGFWHFNRRLFLRFCLATLYAGVLTAGLELAILSADKLFSLNLSKAYGDLWFLMTGLFHPVFFLAGVPRDFSALDRDEEYPRGLKGFTQFALAPLVAVYTAILYTYAVKIVIGRAWPHGWVALPVLLLSGIGILSFLLLYPLRTRPTEKWARWFTINFPRALAPLSLLLLLSVRVRIRAYGVTEERYLGIVLGLWILTWALVFILRQNAGIRWVPSSLAIISLLAAFGPWSAGAVSRASQLHRLEQMLQVHRLWKDGHAAKVQNKVELNPQESTDFQTTLTYLVRAHGGSSVRKIFEPVLARHDWSQVTGWSLSQEVTQALGITSRATSEYGTTVSRKPSTAVIIEGFRRMWRVQLYFAGNSEWNPVHEDDISIGLDHGVLKLAVASGQPQPVPLDTVYQHLDSARGQLPDEQLTTDFQQDGRSFRVIIESVTFRRDSNGIVLNGGEVFLLEK